MNEPDEDLESTLPEEPLPERDVLLEALVDVETETTPRRRFSKTLIAACILSGLGVWQIVHVSNGGEPMFQLAPKPKAAPTKQRSEGRESIGRVLQSTDPIAAYLERAKRGMTDQEIRWMIEDFQAAGLDETSDPEDQKTGYDGYNERFSRILRARQNAWYLIALSEGLDLSSDQKSMARARLEALLERDLKILSDKWNKVREMNGLMLGTDCDKFAKPRLWLLDQGYAPWNLCELSPQQSQITLRQWKTAKDGTPLIKTVRDPFQIIESGPVVWIDPSEIAVQDPASGNLEEFPDRQYPDTFFDEYLVGHNAGILLISDAFPLTPGQTLVSRRGDLLAQAKLVQPAQLRMALLLESDLAAALLEKLDQRSGISSSVGDARLPDANEHPANTPDPETPVDPFVEPDSK